MVVAVIAISLSFFLLLVSFTSNITENAWEFGVLRAVGLTKNQMAKIYIYESVSLALAAGILGSIVGISIATVITSQFTLFTELPLTFDLPWTLLISTYVLAIATSILAPYYAMNGIKDKSISNIIKGL